MELILRDVEPGDLTAFFEYQLDPAANHMAAFTAKDPTDREAFDARWERVLARIIHKRPGLAARSSQSGRPG